MTNAFGATLNLIGHKTRGRAFYARFGKTKKVDEANELSLFIGHSYAILPVCITMLQRGTPALYVW